MSKAPAISLWVENTLKTIKTADGFGHDVELFDNFKTAPKKPEGDALVLVVEAPKDSPEIKAGGGLDRRVTREVYIQVMTKIEDDQKPADVLALASFDVRCALLPFSGVGKNLGLFQSLDEIQCLYKLPEQGQRYGSALLTYQIIYVEEFKVKKV